KTKNIKNILILVLSCKIAEQSLLIQKLLYSRLEEEDFYSIIVLLLLPPNLKIVQSHTCYHV
ncbi:unnamed protein product, partial [Brassica rapa subsp. trilocularis]